MQGIEKIEKRDGRIVPFDGKRIERAVLKAMEAVGEGSKSHAEIVAKEVVETLKKSGKAIPTVEEIQDLVELTLMKKGFYYVSLSDAIRNELKKRNLPLTRNNLLSVGNELRAKFGAGILAKTTLENMEFGRNYVVDSIRNPSEVDELKKTKQFFLFYITAPAEERFNRMSDRRREGDPETLDEFKKLESLELENTDQTKQNLNLTFALADKKIQNNSTVEELYDNVLKAVKEINDSFVEKRPS